MPIPYNENAEKFRLNFEEMNKSKGTYITPNDSIYNEHDVADHFGSHIFRFDSCEYDPLLTGYVGEIGNSEIDLIIGLSYGIRKHKRLLETINYHLMEEFENASSDTQRNNIAFIQKQELNSRLLEVFQNFYNSSNLSLVKSNNEYYIDLSSLVGTNIVHKRRKNPEYEPYHIPELEYLYDFNKTLIKEIIVRHLGYDSIESTRYKTITTSTWNIYERFYNYLLMDYDVFQIPKMILDKKGNYVPRHLTEKHTYEYKDASGNSTVKEVLIQVRDYLISDKELRLKEEIVAIKRLVPLKHRYKYFR